jgi:hypothetical protein
MRNLSECRAELFAVDEKVMTKGEMFSSREHVVFGERKFNG